MNRRLSFGAGDPFGERMRVVELEGAFPPGIVPADFVSAPPPSASPVQIIEPSNGWWNQAGAFGYRYQGPVPDLAGTIIPLTEQIRLPGPPRLWWINWFRFSRDLATEVTNYGTWDLRGRVTYGVGGATNTVEVDVAAGIQMAVVANSLRVDLVTFAPEVDGLGRDVYDPGDVGVIAGAMFGDGAAGGVLPPSWSTQTFTAINIAGAGVLVLDFPIPDFARKVVLHTTETDPAVLANSRLFFNNPGITIKALNLQQVYSQLTGEGVPIPSGTNQVRLQTAAPVAPGTQFSLQFLLAL